MASSYPVSPLVSLYSKEEFERFFKENPIASAEYDHSLFGAFHQVYLAAARAADKGMTILDIGGNLGIQARLFTDFTGYRCVDFKNKPVAGYPAYKTAWELFDDVPGEFIENEGCEYLQNLAAKSSDAEKDSYLVLISAVPDEKVYETAFELFPNVFGWYPGQDARAQGRSSEAILKEYKNVCAEWRETERAYTAAWQKKHTAEKAFSYDTEEAEIADEKSWQAAKEMLNEAQAAKKLVIEEAAVEALDAAKGANAQSQIVFPGLHELKEDNFGPIAQFAAQEGPVSIVLSQTQKGWSCMAIIENEREYQAVSYGKTVEKAVENSFELMNIHRSLAGQEELMIKNPDGSLAKNIKEHVKHVEKPVYGKAKEQPTPMIATENKDNHLEQDRIHVMR